MGKVKNGTRFLNRFFHPKRSAYLDQVRLYKKKYLCKNFSSNNGSIVSVHYAFVVDLETPAKYFFACYTKNGTAKEILISIDIVRSIKVKCFEAISFWKTDQHFFTELHAIVLRKQKHEKMPNCTTG